MIIIYLKSVAARNQIAIFGGPPRLSATPLPNPNQPPTAILPASGN
jgi:hypothetical protein